MTSIFSRKFRGGARTDAAHGGPHVAAAPAKLPSLPPVAWPGEKTHWPAYMDEGREGKQGLIAEAMRRQWFHSVDLGGGFVTKVPEGAQIRHIHQAFLETDFVGKKVLDIGCWDGGWSFAAEQRGAAEVYATDLITQRDQDTSNFELAHQILNSRVKYFPRVNVYDIHELGVHDFDVIIYMGVFYHVKDPLLALGRLRQVAKPGAVILCEGETVWSDKSFAEFYYSDQYARSESNWWVPSIPCVAEWLACNYFQVEKEYREHDGIEAYWQQRKGYGRCLTKARALPVPPIGQDDPKNFYSRYDFLEGR